MLLIRHGKAQINVTDLIDEMCENRRKQITLKPCMLFSLYEKYKLAAI